MSENELIGNDIFVFGYTGAYCDPVTGGYPLGNGYRVYLPELMRFVAPDGWSPFGKGGMNPYLYGSDDPINHSDPSGHLSVLAWIGIAGGAAGIAAALSPFALAALGTLGTDLTMGAAVAIAKQEATVFGTVSFLSGVAADVIGGLSSAYEDNNKNTTTVYSGISIAFAVASLGFGLAGSARYLRRIVPSVERAAQTERDLRAAQSTFRTQRAATQQELDTTGQMLTATRARLAATEEQLTTTRERLAATEEQLTTTRAQLAATEERVLQAEVVLQIHEGRPMNPVPPPYAQVGAPYQDAPPPYSPPEDEGPPGPPIPPEGQP